MISLGSKLDLMLGHLMPTLLVPVTLHSPGSVLTLTLFAFCEAIEQSGMLMNSEMNNSA